MLRITWNDFICKIDNLYLLCMRTINELLLGLAWRWWSLQMLRWLWDRERLKSCLTTKLFELRGLIKDGTSRLRVDYRQLNGVGRKDVYQLPHVDDILDTLCDTKNFSLDLCLRHIGDWAPPNYWNAYMNGSKRWQLKIYRGMANGCQM